MHAHEGLADAARESALKVDSGRNIPCCTGDLNPPQYCALAFQQDALPTESFSPHVSVCSPVYLAESPIETRVAEAGVLPQVAQVPPVVVGGQSVVPPSLDIEGDDVKTLLLSLLE